MLNSCNKLCIDNAMFQFILPLKLDFNSQTFKCEYHKAIIKVLIPLDNLLL